MWVATVYPYQKLAPVAANFRDAWAAAGHSEGEYQLGIGAHCHVGATSQAARESFRPHFGAYFEASANIEKSNLKRRVQPTARDMSLFDDVPFCGSAAEVVDRIAAARDLLGLTRMALVIDLGGMSQGQVLDQIGMLGEEVLPAFAD
jgi:alkanesulfonate monooxygenase SsuD/methylene tetrahydromethanopterin reductase-like flavin-dependent oxidoreductase (luciferase family)